MHHLSHTAALTTSRAFDIIFDACRANDARKPWSDGAYRVEFMPAFNEYEHMATVLDCDDHVVAGAVVDQYDR